MINEMLNSDSRIKILLTIAGLPAGGAERQLVLLAKNLDRSEFDVGVLIFNAREKVFYQDIFDYPLWIRHLDLSRDNSGLSLIPKMFWGIRQAVSDFKPDLIHTTLNVANHAVRFSTMFMKYNNPIVTSVRVEYVASYKPHEKLMERMLCRRSNHIICNSEKTRGELKHYLRIAPDKTSTIPNGLDDSFYVNSQDRPSSWPKGRTCLTVSRFTKQKNHTSLIEAIASLEQKKVLEDWSFVFLGEGPLHSHILSLINRYALKDRIKILAPRQNMPSVYQAADLFILPSLYEGMSNSLLEAAASECPIIVNKEADEAGLINNDRGWVVNNSLQKTLETVISLPKKTREKKGKAASVYVKQNFNSDKVVDETVKVYRKLLC